MRRLTTLCLLLPAFACGARPDEEVAKAGLASVVTAAGTPLTATEDVTALEYGSAVATDGQSALVAAKDDTNDESVAFLFSRAADGWKQSKRFSPSSPSYFFGQALAVKGDTIAIGDGGEVFVYRGEGTEWALESTLESGTITVTFGGALALGSDCLAIGDERSGASDSAYVFERIGTSWSKVALLKADDPATDVAFGHSVALQDGVLAVGAPGTLLGGGYPGAVYVFRLQGGAWVKTQVLTSAEAAPDGFFGGSVALSGATLVVGAWRDGFGKVHVFEDVAGTFQGTDVLSSQADSIGFGDLVAIDQDVILVGSGGSTDFSGSVEVFQRSSSGWASAFVVSEGSLSPGADFGTTLALSGKTAAVGAPGGDAAYAYQLLEDTHCSPDGAAVVDTTGKSTACAPYRCVESSCATSCQSSAECAPGNVCDTSLGDGQCVAGGNAVESDGGGCQATQSPATHTGVVLAALLAAIALGLRRRVGWSFRE